MKPASIGWPLYVRNGIGRRLSLLGERLGADALIYNPLVMNQFHDQGLRDARIVVPALLDAFPSARSVLDVGCGSGVFAAEFARRERKVIGLERSRHGIAIAERQGVECRSFDLTRTPPADVPGSFDMVYCFEVAEHLTPELGDRLVEYLAGFGAPVIFSAAQPGQGGTGHINEQPPQYWLDRFACRSFAHDAGATRRLRERFATGGAARWFQNNVVVVLPARLTQD
jgi:SAM-dependent methyltransferase